MIGDGHGNDMMRNMAQNVNMLEHEIKSDKKKVTKRQQRIGRIVVLILFIALLIFFAVIFIRY